MDETFLHTTPFGELCKWMEKCSYQFSFIWEGFLSPFSDCVLGGFVGDDKCNIDVEHS